MTATIRPAPVEHSILVQAPVERAFSVFTAGFGAWWPATHSIGSSSLARAILEPRQGGRWYEVGEDGSECQWGDVLVWEPPHRLVLAWRIGADWRFDAGLLTEVEVRFTAEDDGTTRVDLEHRLIENLGAAAESAAESFNAPGGWPGLLVAYAGKASA